jgi:hypothetical protein
MRHYNRDRRTDFFAQNFLLIGYQAWQGYLNCGRGLVVISSEIDLLDDSDRYLGDRSILGLNFRYIPQAQLLIYLQEWLVPDDSLAEPLYQRIEPIISAVADYQPEAELVFAVESGVKLDIGWCQNLPVLPPACYQQIDRRLSEFQLTI